LCGACPNNKAFDDLKQHLCSAPVLSLPDLQQPFEIETDASDYVVGAVLTQHDHPWPIIVRHYQMSFVSTLLMKNKCTPLCKPTASGSITFSGRRQSSTLIISHCSSCRHKENCRMITIRSGPHTCSSSTSTSSIKQEVPTESLISSTDLQSWTLTMVLDSCGHETSGWPHLYETDPDFATPTRCWVQTQLSLISIFRMGCCAIWAISMFHQDRMSTSISGPALPVLFPNSNKRLLTRKRGPVK
jgi:hypothetical protein